ncbi:cytochrome P450 [Mycena pura]|uniref:Cytochrome P450 n=1 Tax=Mycena pura TaxID=153505 RepID=A0AAD6VEG4_9AGAR|nr:cytochrome P450 [Mycena pura]
MISITLTDIGVVAAALSLSAFYHFRTRRMQRLPPGPKGYPFIGNVFDMPESYSWKTFAKWGEQYGGIMSVTLLRQPFIIINDAAIAAEILDRRGYADRPTCEMGNLCGWDRVLSSARYGPRFREYRKLIAKEIGTRGGMEKFYSVEDHQGNMLLKRVLDDPSGFNAAIKNTVAAIVMQLTYGYTIKEDGNDPFVVQADKAMAEFSHIFRPGAFLIEVLPILKYVPSWFPGANFKRLVEKYSDSCDDMAEIPLAYVKEQMELGQAASSYAANRLSEAGDSDQRQFDIKWSAASFYGETTASVVTLYFLVAAKYPHIQARAQAEMDNVVGPHRLPTFGDRDALPYLDALCKELSRYLPVVPLAAPHRAMRDDVYGEFFIPEGSIVLPNVWKFLHDPAVYRDPFLFNPDRFLGSHAEPHPADMGLFGYGRRCIHLADVSVWICVAKAVAALAIAPAVDARGARIEVVADVTDGLLCHPVPFKCDVRARSERVRGLVGQATTGRELRETSEHHRSADRT